MNNMKRLKSFIIAAKPHVIRLVYVLFLMTFFMPYVSVTGCSSHKVTDYYGYELFTQSSGLIYLVPIVLFIFFLVVSFIKIKGQWSRGMVAFMQGWKAILASFSGAVIIILPQLQFLFDDVRPLAGVIIALSCCVAVFALSMVSPILYFRQLRLVAVMNLRSGGDYSRFWSIFNFLVIIGAIATVPFYFIENINDITLAILTLFFLTIPFILIQVIVLAGIKGNERWSIRWSKFLLVVFFAALISLISSTITIY